MGQNWQNACAINLKLGAKLLPRTCSCPMQRANVFDSPPAPPPLSPPYLVLGMCVWLLCVTGEGDQIRQRQISVHVNQCVCVRVFIIPSIL